MGLKGRGVHIEREKHPRMMPFTPAGHLESLVHLTSLIYETTEGKRLAEIVVNTQKGPSGRRSRKRINTEIKFNLQMRV